MEEGWVSSLSIATSVNTLSANGSSLFGDSLELADGGSFPPPPPRTRSPSLVSGSSQVYDGHDTAKKMLRSPAIVFSPLGNSQPSSRPHSSGGSSRNAHKARERRSNSDNGHSGWADSATQEPLEQLRSGQYDARRGLPSRENVGGHPSWRVRHMRSHTSASSASSAAPLSDPSDNLARQRPQVVSGLPTSYSHHRDHSKSAPLPESSHLSQSQSQSQSQSHTQAQHSGSTAAQETSAKSPFRPFLSSSPAIHFGNLDRPWAHWLSDDTAKSAGSAAGASNHSRAPSNSLREPPSSTDYSHSRYPSLSFSVATRPSTPDSSLEPSRSTCITSAEKQARPEAQPARAIEHSLGDSFEELRGDTGPTTRARSDSAPMSRSLPNLFAAPATTTTQQHVAWGPKVPQQGQGSQATVPQGANTALVITDSVRSPHYLEPYNSCEAIAFPRPRLRSRSLATTPSIVVEKVHAAPERFWQTTAQGKGAERMQIAPRSSILRSAEAPHDDLQPSTSSSGQAGAARFSAKDYRLKLHETIPPPLPPRDSPLPSSGVLPPKPLPASPLPQAAPSSQPHTAPLPRMSHESFDSIELLDAAELLQLNEELEQERRAWREESRTGMNVDYNALRDRFSPCLRDPSLANSSRHGSAVSVGGDLEADTSRVRVHRMFNKDGSEHTVLVVRPRQGHPYGSQRMSVSSPELRKGRDTSPKRVPLVKHFAQRLGSFATSRRPPRTSATTSQEHGDARKSPRLTPGADRSFGKQRKLVSDETVIIGKPPEPTNGVGTAMGQWESKEQEATSQEGRRALEHATVPETRRASLSKYRPAGTKDEIKAQLSESVPPMWRRQSGAPRSAGKEHVTDVEALPWIDPGSKSKLVHRASFRARQPQHDTEELAAERGDRSAYSSWSEYVSRRGSNRSSGRRRSAHLSEGDMTRASSVSTETPGEVVLWDASSVNIDDLFFRPPQ